MSVLTVCSKTGKKCEKICFDLIVDFNLEKLIVDCPEKHIYLVD